MAEEKIINNEEIMNDDKSRDTQPAENQRMDSPQGQENDENEVTFEFTDDMYGAMNKFGYTEESFKELDPETAKRQYNLIKSYTEIERMNTRTSQELSELKNQFQSIQQQQNNPQQVQPQQQQSSLDFGEDGFDPYNPEHQQKLIASTVNPLIQSVIATTTAENMVKEFRDKHPNVGMEQIHVLANVAQQNGLSSLDEAYDFVAGMFGGNGQQPNTRQETGRGQTRTITIPQRGSGGGASQQSGPSNFQDVIDFVKNSSGGL